MCTILYPAEYVFYLWGQYVTVLQRRSIQRHYTVTICEAQTLDAHELPEFEGGTAHLCQLRH